MLDTKYSAPPIQFVNQIIEHLILHGATEVSRLYEVPYTDLNPMSLDGLFSKADAQAISQFLTGLQAGHGSVETPN